jgi:hypothetical protein
MSQNRTLHIEIIRDRHAKPLAIVKNFPGLDAEMYSDSLRKMAAQLIQAADDLEALNSEQSQVISHAQTKQVNKPNIDFSHRVPFSVKKGDSFALYQALYPTLQRAAAVADLFEVACQETNKADFSPDTLWRGAETIRFEIKDAQALLDAYYGVQP